MAHHCQDISDLDGLPFFAVPKGRNMGREGMFRRAARLLHGPFFDDSRSLFPTSSLESCDWGWIIRGRFFFMMGGNAGLDDPQVPTSIWGSEVGGVVGREEDHRYFVDVSTVPYC